MTRQELIEMTGNEEQAEYTIDILLKKRIYKNCNQHRGKRNRERNTNSQK